MLRAFAVLVVMSVACLTSSVVLAKPAPVSDEAFLAGLQVPQTATSREAPALLSTDIALPCIGCEGCTNNGRAGLRLCSTCNGAKTCGPCGPSCQLPGPGEWNPVDAPTSPTPMRVP